MNNLLDNAYKINPNILAEQVAEMEVYRISSYIKMLLHNAYYYLVKFINYFKDSSANKGLQVIKESFESNKSLKSKEILRNNQVMIIYQQLLPGWLQKYLIRRN